MSGQEPDGTSYTIFVIPLQRWHLLITAKFAQKVMTLPAANFIYTSNLRMIPFMRSLRATLACAFSASGKE